MNIFSHTEVSDRISNDIKNKRSVYSIIMEGMAAQEERE